MSNPITSKTRDAGHLPEDIRPQIASSSLVKVTIRDHSSRPAFLQLRGVAAQNGVGIEEAVARVRSLRDDRD